MKKYNIKLREKITMIFIIVSTIMCLGLTLSVFRSADRLVEAVPTSSAMRIAGIDEPQTTMDAQHVFPAQQIEQANTTFRIQTLYMMIGIILLGSISIYYLTGKALKPLKVLTDSVDKQGVEDLVKEISLPKSEDEVFRLTEAFNKRNKQIFDSYSIQKNFSANAAHELYTPLAVMQTKLDVFSLSKERSLEEYQALIRFMDENTQRLTAIIENLMKITNSDDIELTQEIFINELIEETLFELEDEMDKKSIIAQVTGECVVIRGNDALMKQAFYNLINNAIKYNVDGGNITVNITNLKDAVHISIKDSGIGVPDESKEHLFEPFYRVDSSRSREVGGSGLGLALVKKIIEVHRGEIKISDNTPHGTEFSIILQK
ncbi:sensor histidine kinase [Anaerotignum sp.]|uniref:sensor histidine kinase n=1 Tax=Anaerotignum sp. TaxID=2039241 RepID=UPI0028A7A16F|nr:ATP-binding protein [Anaerotignum sp.]